LFVVAAEERASFLLLQSWTQETGTPMMEQASFDETFSAEMTLIALKKLQLLPSRVGPVLDSPLGSAKRVTRMVDAAEVVDDLHLGR